MWLWGWPFYHSCLHIDGRIMFWILKNISLTLRDTLERTPEAISNQNFSGRFLSWYWTIIQKMNSKSDWPWKFWGRSVFDFSQVGLVVSPSVKKWANLHPSDSPTKILEILPAIGCFCRCLPICKKSNFLFWITLGTSDHIHLKWLQKFVTSIDSIPYGKKLTS